MEPSHLRTDAAWAKPLHPAALWRFANQPSLTATSERFTDRLIATLPTRVFGPLLRGAIQPLAHRASDPFLGPLAPRTTITALHQIHLLLRMAALYPLPPSLIPTSDLPLHQMARRHFSTLPAHLQPLLTSITTRASTYPLSEQQNTFWNVLGTFSDTTDVHLLTALSPQHRLPFPKHEGRAALVHLLTALSPQHRLPFPKRPGKLNHHAYHQTLWIRRLLVLTITRYAYAPSDPADSAFKPFTQTLCPRCGSDLILAHVPHDEPNQPNQPNQPKQHRTPAALDSICRCATEDAIFYSALRHLEGA